MNGIESLLTAFVYVFIIMDPFASLPMLIALTKNFSAEKTARVVSKACMLAGIIAFVFIFTGAYLLQLMQITLGDFKIAGGIVLSLLALETLFGINAYKKVASGAAVTVLLATPLLTGPGIITTLIVLVKEQGVLLPSMATLLALLCSYAVLSQAHAIKRRVGWQAMEIVARIFGLLVLAIGVSFIRSGLA